MNDLVFVFICFICVKHHVYICFICVSNTMFMGLIIIKIYSPKPLLTLPTICVLVSHIIELLHTKFFNLTRVLLLSCINEHDLRFINMHNGIFHLLITLHNLANLLYYQLYCFLYSLLRPSNTLTIQSNSESIQF